jgi:hypothetical protein
VKVGVAFISDRDPQLYLQDCTASFWAHVQDPHGLIGDQLVVDDSNHDLGMAGAVNAAWSWAVAQDLDYLFHVEEDFVFRHDFSLRAMMFALTWGKDLAQMVLKRQPWSPEEQAVGNIARMGEIAQQDMHTDALGTIRWCVHNRIFSLNPCLIPREIFEVGWPSGNEAEATMLMRASGYSFAFFGGIDDLPMVEHVGHVRGEGWKL